MKYFTFIFICISFPIFATTNWEERRIEQQRIYEANKLQRKNQEFIRKENDRLINEMKRLEYNRKIRENCIRQKRSGC
jgi:hypothetical protein